MSPQAPKPPAPSPTPDRRFAKDVAKHLDRRRMRRRLFGWTFVLGAIALAASYLTCGQGFGLGGKGPGKGEGSGPGSGSVQALISPDDAGPSRCQIRIAASGITVAGKPATVDEALAACKGVTAAEVLVTGGAREGDWEDLKAAFDHAGIQILRVEPKGGSAGSAGSPGSPNAGDTGNTGNTGSADGSGSAGSAAP
jgi:hypothetical protein